MIIVMMMIMALRIMKEISQCNPHDDDCEEGDDNHDDYFSDDNMNT